MSVLTRRKRSLMDVVRDAFKRKIPAIEELGKTNSEVAKTALFELLSDPCPEVRRSAALQLKKFYED